MIACRQLTRDFGDFRAVDSVTFEIAEGSICAFLGPNGAGKSTLVKMLTGLLAPTSGSAQVYGMDPTKAGSEFKRIIGVLPETLGLFDALTVSEHLELSGTVYGLTRGETVARADQLLRLLRLDDGRDTYLNQCSYGMRKKTALAMALIHNPRALFLDEPFEGIDPVTAETIRHLLHSIAGHGVTVLLTSHILSLVDQVASQVMMMRQGKLAWNSAIADVPGKLEDLYFELVEPVETETLSWLGSARS